MLSRAEILSRAVGQTVPLLERYLAGFDDTNHTRQAAGLPNHVAWSLGHLAITLHRCAEKLDGQPLPEQDFGAGGKESGRFSPESVAFGSQPCADAAAFPDFARCRQVFQDAASRLTSALLTTPDARLDELVPWGKVQTSIGDLAIRMVFHNGAHQGQIADLRRALGMPSVFA